MAVASAGLAASTGQPAAAQGQDVARTMGLDLSSHRSRHVRDLIPGANDLWLAMTPAQAEDLRVWLGSEAAVDVLLPFARRLGAAPAEGDAVPDPLGQGPDAYVGVARLLEQALSTIVSSWREELCRGARGFGPKTKTLALPRLNGLRPTLESTALKLLEEAGELAEGIGKYRALSGERADDPLRRVMATIGQELLDVAQTAVTMMFVLEEQYAVNLQGMLHEHIRKLAAKGYLSSSVEQGMDISAPSPPEDA